MSSKAVENGLPALPLLLNGVGLLRVERLSNHDTPVVANELNDCYTATEGHLNQLVGNDLGVSPGEVETKTAVLGLHARGERATDSQIYRGGCGVPVIGCSVPLLDVIRRRPCAPDLFDWCSDRGLYCDFH